MMPRVMMLALVSAVIAVSASPADAGAPNFDDTTLTGNWGGLRTTLYNKGVSLNLSYTSNFAHNFTGGDRRTSGYAAAWDFTGGLDFGKMFGWQGGSFQVELVNFNGTLLDTKANLGTFLATEEIFANGHVTYLANFYFQQSLWHGLVDVRYGRMDMATNFFPFSCDFQYLGFCSTTPGWIVNDLTAWPTSAIGAAVVVHPSKQWKITVGNFADQPNNLVPSQGIKPQNRGHRTGNMTVAEVDFDTNLAAGASGSGLPGTWSVGGWHNSAPQPDLLLDADGAPQVLTGAAPLMRGSAGGFYFTAQQQVTTNRAGGGITVFANFVRADGNVVSPDQLASVGMIYAAPFASRPGDSLGLAIGQNRASSKVSESQRILNASGLGVVPVQGSEYVGEVNYVFQLPRGVSVMPNVQYVHHPGGTRANHDVLVFGAQLIVSL